MYHSCPCFLNAKIPYKLQKIHFYCLHKNWVPTTRRFVVGTRFGDLIFRLYTDGGIGRVSSHRPP